MGKANKGIKGQMRIPNKDIYIQNIHTNEKIIENLCDELGFIEYDIYEAEYKNLEEDKMFIRCYTNVDDEGDKKNEA